MKFNLSHFENQTVEEIHNGLNKAGKIINIELNMSSIGTANSYLDIVDDYLTASFIGELLCKVSKEIDYQENYFEYGLPYKSMIFQIRPRNLLSLAEEIYFITQASDLFYDQRYKHELEILEGKETIKFPKIADSFLANYIGGCYFELENEDVIAEISRFPERKYGYWRSLFSNSIGFDIYISVNNGWIVPNEVNLKDVLEFYLDIKELELQNAALLMFRTQKVLISSGYLVGMPEGLLNAQKCASIINKNEKNNLLDFNYLHDTTIIESFISSSGNIVVFQDEKYSYIFFYPEKLLSSDISHLRQNISITINSIDLVEGINSDISCDWSKLDDDTFETLCYDVLYYNERFDSKTIRKMGKSRSRDGGRDIVVWTKALPGERPKKYIFQCKLYKPGSSLTASKVIGISDIIHQYNADGYGVMTSVVIDSTLYDTLDGISETMTKRGLKLETDNWSFLELERFLAMHPMIKVRYF
ncbi:restriction endonuclease [Peribacillus kribbensis]|uniref:restriction endonuclease n=1 Tax=Peribacillus kribbensis TaxID=356658 RepID=UPI0004122F05|nr:restriction endonuclease [Peribacillus kribbensis]